MPSERLVLNGIAEIKEATGKQFGPSDWVVVTQEIINLFAESTGDFQWIHVDAERAKTESPFGTTIAHGYLTLSLGPRFLEELVDFQDISMVINYGINKVRFPSPVITGSSVRMSGRVVGVEDIAGGVQTTMELTFELQENPKPACVAEIVFRQYA